eukprot:261196_1
MNRACTTIIISEVESQLNSTKLDNEHTSTTKSPRSKSNPSAVLFAIQKYEVNGQGVPILMNDYDRSIEIPKCEPDSFYTYVGRYACPYVIQIGMVIGAGIVSYGAIVSERKGRTFSEKAKFGTMGAELIYTPCMCGIMSVITSIIGCIGAKSRDKCRKYMLFMYMVALYISLALGIASVVQGFGGKLNVYKYAQRQWDQLTLEQKRHFEWEHFCCNFNTLDPCCRFTYGERECVNEYVCYEKVKPHLEENFQ